jgi:hypothetical protein
MPLTGCTIQTIFPSDNPNEGRVKINQNFQCLTNNISGSGSGSGITSSSGNRWYIPPGETVTINSTYQGFIYGDLVVDGTLNLEDDSQIVILNGTLINTGGTINASSGATIYVTDTPDIYMTGGTYSSGTITFSVSNGETFDVTGLPTGSTLFFNTFSNFPSGGTNDAIYVDDTNNIGYLWNSTLSAYTNIAGTQNLDEIPLTFAQAATASALLGNPFYTNGLSGVGATLTATTVGVLADNTGTGRIDLSYIPQVGDVLLVKNQTSALQNGLYTIDDTGSLTTRYKLTRVSGFDQSSELYPLQVNVLGGSNNALKYFIQSTVNPVIGTSGLVFSISSQQSISPQIAFVDTATSAPLPSCTYISGTTYSTLPGVGAVLSATSVGALGFINGLSASTNSSSVQGFLRILVKDQVNPAHNGDYSVTNAGSPTTKWVLTRLSDWAGAYSRYTRFFLVSNNGSTKAGKYYFTTPNSPALTNATIGTAPINIVEYGGVGGTTFTGGTVSGATTFTAGLSATSISATTYYGLPASLLWFAEPSYAPTTPPSVLGTDSIAIGNNSQAPSAYAFSVGTNAGYQATNVTNSNFIGQNAGQQATGSSYSNFLGQGAGYQSSSSTYSNFLGFNSGSQATGSNNSNFFGWIAGYQAVGSNNSNFIGQNAGQQAINSSNSNFLGNSAGYQATGSSYSNFLGTSAGFRATGSTYSNFFGVNAGYLAKDVSYSNFFGNGAGQSATNVSNSNFLGFNSGSQATGSTYSNFFGYQAGSQATGASYSNFLGNSAGQLAINSSNSNFIGYQAGSQATGSTYSNFLGTNAGYQSPSSNFSNFFGLYAGQQATNVSHSNFFGNGAGQSATGSTGSNFLGYLAGYLATGSSYSNFLGFFAGQLAIGASYSNFLGNSAGYQARTASNSNFFGVNSGYQATGSTSSNFFGPSSGYQATGSSQSNFLGNQAGYQAKNSTDSNFLGYQAGFQATNSSYSNFFGNSAGQQAINSIGSNFFGAQAGQQATGSTYSNFFGYQSGYQATGSSYSNFFGYNAGRSFVGNSLGSNNIIIGTNISLSGGTANSMNIGGVLFGSGLYSSVLGDPSITRNAGGRIGVGVVSPLSTFHVSGDTRLDGGLTAVTISALGLTASTISATTYQGLPADVNIYNSNGTLSGLRTINLSGNSLVFSSSTSGANKLGMYGSGNGSTSRTFFEMGQISGGGISSSVFFSTFSPTYSGSEWGSFYAGSSMLSSYHETTATTGGFGNMFFDISHFGSTVANRYFAWHAAPTLTARSLSTEMMRLHVLGNGDGNLGINVKGVPRERLHISGNTLMQGSLTATTATISGTGQNILTVIGSGNTSPLFSVQGSYGELFSITDSLSGSLFSVNDISGLPILEVFDDNTTLMGSFLAPSLNTTVKTSAGIGDTNIYSIIASAYTGAFFEYTASNSGGTRAGSIMSVWSGSSITWTETPTASIGLTTGITFNMTIGTTATLRASGTTAGWTVKTIVRSI